MPGGVSGCKGLGLSTCVRTGHDASGQLDVGCGTGDDVGVLESDIGVVAVIAAAVVAALSVVYVWSKDQGRRERAWRLIKLLLGR